MIFLKSKPSQGKQFYVFNHYNTHLLISDSISLINIYIQSEHFWKIKGILQ